MPAKKAAKKKIAPDLKATPVDPLDALSPKQRVFVLEYLANGFNATKAAMAAGYSKKTADSQGSRLLKNVKVAAAIAARTKVAMEKREISAERTLAGIDQLASFDPRRMFNPFGSLLPVTELGDDEAMALTGFEVTERTLEDGTLVRKTKVRFANRLAAHELLAKRQKLLGQGPDGTKDDPFHVSFKSILSGG